MAIEAARDAARESIRETALSATRRLLLHEGPAALSMRRIAREIGSSTTVLYTLFGNKQQLIDALWVDGMYRLTDAQQAAAASTSDPTARLRALGEAYRTFALDDPDTYRLLFAGAVPGYHPSPEALALGRRSMTPLVDAVLATLPTPARGDAEAHASARARADVMAATLWATVHGVVSLELAGHFTAEEGRAVATQAMAAIGIGLRITAAAGVGTPDDESGATSAPGPT